MKTVLRMLGVLMVVATMPLAWGQTHSAPAHGKPHAKAVAAPVQDAYQRALVAVRTGQISTAHALLRQRLRETPQDMAACRLLATLLIDSGQRDEAITVLAAGQAQAPQDVDVVLALARLLADRGDFAQALQTLDKSAAYASRNAPYLAFTATLADQAGQSARAVPLWQQALQLAPQEGAWWVALGQVQLHQRDLAGARQSFEAALASGHLDPARQREARLALRQLKVPEKP